MNLLMRNTPGEAASSVKAVLAGITFLSLSLPLSAQNVPSGPAVDSIPAAWQYTSDHYTTLPSEDNWWAGFDDPVLTKLIEMGESNSFDLSAAAHRIEMARRTMEITRAGYSPTIGVSAGWNASRSSGALTTPTVPGNNTSFFNLGLNFSWEVDLFGRIREQSKADKAQYNATKAEYSAAMISLSSNIAQAYINLRLAQARIEVAKRQIQTQERISKITQARYETGLASKLDVTQALTVLYTTQANLPGLENSEGTALNSLALLIGVYPDQIADLVQQPHKELNPFRMVSIGVPSDLIRRRPDILEAEHELAAYAAQIGIAKKDFLPTLTLNGSIGTEAHEVKDLFSKHSFTYSVAPSLSWTVFEGLARNKRVAYAKEQMLAGIDNYNMTVMNAVIETENALGAYDTSLKQISLMKKVVTESQESFELAVDRYKRGLSAFTDVMNSLVTVLDNENSLLQTRANALTTLINVYAAVAGSPTDN